MSRSRISIWVVEDNESQLKEVVDLLYDVTGFHCTGAFLNCEQMFASAESRPEVEWPDVVLMDYELDPEGKNHMTGVEGARQLKQRREDIAIVMLTINDSTQVIYQALGAGACGYLVKPSSIDELIAAIRQAHWGGMWMPPMVAQRVSAFFRDSTAPDDENVLTDREVEVMQLMEQGHKKKQLALHLNISHHTVDSHLRNIYQKLHVKTAAEAVSKAIRKGMI